VTDTACLFPYLSVIQEGAIVDVQIRWFPRPNPSAPRQRSLLSRIVPQAHQINLCDGDDDDDGGGSDDGRGQDQIPTLCDGHPTPDAC
jgi:hypothetical protein